MKITAIKQQVRRQDRYSIYIDSKYMFSFSQSELMNSGLKVGRELTQQELDELQDTATVDKAYDRALNLISYRPRSEGEIREYLRRKDLTGHDITTVVNRLTERGYLDDADFARRWVATRRLLKSTSKRRLMQELRQKRVSSDIISQALEDDETDERGVLRELIARKRKQTTYQDNLKLMQYLSRQGYNYDDIKTVINE
jgi:regulatory protein